MKVCELTPGVLLRFSADTGPIPDTKGASLGYGDTIHTARRFGWTWEEGLIPCHMVYVGRRRVKDKLWYEVLWHNRLRRLSGHCVKHLERVSGSEDIQWDDRASTPLNTSKNMK